MGVLVRCHCFAGLCPVSKVGKAGLHLLCLMGLSWIICPFSVHQWWSPTVRAVGCCKRLHVLLYFDWSDCKTLVPGNIEGLLLLWTFIYDHLFFPEEERIKTCSLSKKYFFFTCPFSQAAAGARSRWEQRSKHIAHPRILWHQLFLWPQWRRWHTCRIGCELAVQLDVYVMVHTVEHPVCVYGIV